MRISLIIVIKLSNRYDMRMVCLCGGNRLVKLCHKCCPVPVHKCFLIPESRQNSGAHTSETTDSTSSRTETAERTDPWCSMGSRFWLPCCRWSLGSIDLGRLRSAANPVGTTSKYQVVLLLHAHCIEVQNYSAFENLLSACS